MSGTLAVTKCPVCNAPLPDNAFTFHKLTGFVTTPQGFVHLPQQQGEVFAAILRHGPIDSHRLTDLTYWGKKQPNDAAKCLHQFISRMRETLGSIGVEVVNLTGNKGSHGSGARAVYIIRSEYRRATSCEIPEKFGDHV